MKGFTNMMKGFTCSWRDLATIGFTLEGIHTEGILTEGMLSEGNLSDSPV